MTTTPPPDDQTEDIEGVPSEAPDVPAAQFEPAAQSGAATDAGGRKRLYRSRTDEWFGGVAGGLAEYFDTDATLIRVVLVVLAFVSAGFAIVGYIAAWIVIPEAPSGTPEAAARPRSSNTSGLVWGFLLILVGLIFLASQLDLDIDFAIWEVAAAAALILVGLFMVYEARRGLNAGLMTLALLLTAVLGVSQAADFDLAFDGAFSESTARVDRVEDLQDSYSHAFGSLTLDLRDMEIPVGETVEVSVNVVFGEATVLLPDDAAARFDLRSVFGSVEGGPVEASGIASSRDYTPPGWDEADRRIEVTLSTVFGSGSVR